MTSRRERKTTFQLTEPERDTLPKKILLWLLQVFAVVAAIVSVTFTILAWQNSENAESQANVANLVAFLSFCGDLTSNGAANLTLASVVCATHASIAEAQFRAYATANLPTPTDREPSGSSYSGVGSSRSTAIGAIVGGVTGGIALISIITLLTYWNYRRQHAMFVDHQLFVPTAQAHEEEITRGQHKGERARVD